MSTGNAAAAIGLANTNKILSIGAYVQDVGAVQGDKVGNPGPEAYGPYNGLNGTTSYDRNVIGEDKAFVAPSNAGAAAGKDAIWSTNSGGTLAAGTTRCDVTAGVATANNSTGLYDVFCVAPTVTALPVNSWFWTFTR